jgi:aspartate racemase
MSNSGISDSMELSAEELKLLAYLLEQEGLDLPKPQTIFPRGAHDTLPLSFAQERLWFLDQWDPGAATYNLPWPMRMVGRLDVGALRAGLNAVIQRHEALRTSFPAVDGLPTQVIAPRLEIGLPLVDLQALPAALREPTALRLLTAAARVGFDLAAGPLVSVLLIRLTTAEHAVLLNMHHIICDGWSMVIFIQELAAFYREFALGQPAELPDLAIQYADFALWQRAWLQGEVLETQLDYWRRQLGGRFPVLDLPTDRPRPPVQTHSGAREAIMIDAATVAGLQVLCQQEGATRFMVLLAAFSLLLARYSGQADIVVGAPIANRDLVEIEGLIGYFVNTLVLRTDLARPVSFRELLRQVRDTTLDAHAHQNIPFEQLVEKLQSERDPSRSALFQVMFVLQNMPPAVYEFPDLAMRPITIELGTAKFDLLLSLSETAYGLRGGIEYNSDLFDTTTIQRLSNHFQTLLRHAAADASQRVAYLPLLSAAERMQLIVEWNQTDVAARDDGSVEQLIAGQVVQRPDAIALVCQDQHLTYRALDSRADRLAARLRACGVGPETIMGVDTARSLELIVGLLGVLKAGGAYLPLDPGYPAERLRFMIDDAQAQVLITTKDERRRTNDEETQPESLHDLGLVIDVMRAAPAAIVNRTSKIVHADNLAYVIYTSGSTGTPKGVLVTRQGLVNHCRAAISCYALSATDRVLQLASLSFDLAAEEIYPTLASGATLVLWPHQAPATAHEFLGLADQERLTVLDLTTPLWQVWATEQASPALPIPAALRLVIVGGDRALAEPYAAWRRTIPARVRWINSYGPTEATIIATLHAPDVGAPISPWGGMAIGRPIANTQVYLLDRQMQPVPIGVPGELFIGGAGLARGYLNRPDLTAERFVPNPFATTNDEGRTTNDETNARLFVLRPSSFVRLYATGDLARHRPDGTIDYLGRRDQQVKLRGYRIELGEIETVLAQHALIQEAVVVAHAAGPHDQRLVAYVVPANDERQMANDAEGAAPAALRPPSFVQDVRDHLQQRLPDYMLPSAFVQLDALPRTPTGKLDRNALPAPELRAASAAYVAPRDRLELQLVQLWEELLVARPIGVTDPFFALGGHSLLAVRLMARLRELTGVALSLATLFRHPTIAQLARVLRDQAAPAAPAALVGITTGGTNPPLFCIHPLGGNVLCYAQLARQLGPAQPVYGLQAPGLEHDQALPTTVESMAAEYVAAIRAFQPAGPYLLCGWSVGGVIAFEIAQQLTGQGQPVALLALLDSPASQPIRVRAPDDHWLLIGMAQQLGLNPDHAALQPLDAEQQLASVLALAQRSDALLPGLDLAQLRRLFAVYKANAYALLGYRPRAYAGRVTLFQAHATAQVSDLAPGWRALARRGVASWAIPGDHDTMLQEPYVRVLADRLTAAIAQARLLSRTEERTR